MHADHQASNANPPPLLFCSTTSQHAYKTYAELPCFGTRAYLGMHTPQGAKFPLKVFGDTTWMTYAEVSIIIDLFFFDF
jgi:hypothetical protein